MNYLRKIFFCLAAVCLAAGCASDNEEDLYPETVTCNTSAVTYSGTVKPILQRSCISCHATAVASGGIILDSYTEVIKPAGNGRLVGAITHASGFKPMPQGGNKLPDCEIAAVKKWVENGMPNN